MREYPSQDDVHPYGMPVRAFGPRLAALLLLLAGWILGLLAIELLHSMAQRTGFVLAGIAVQLVGVGLLARSHMSKRKED